MASRKLINIIAWLPVIYSFAIIIMPFASMIYYSLFDYDLGREPIFIGPGNFITLILKDSVFHKAFCLTLLYTAAALAIEFPLGLIIAFLLYRISYGRTLFTIIVILPLTIAPAVAGIIWRLLFDVSYGHVNYYLSLIGIGRIPWLISPQWSIIACIITDIWQWTPFIILVALAGLLALPKELLESAYVDGASAWVTFKDILFPRIKPLIAIVLFLRLVDALKAFDNIYTMTGGGPGTSTTTISIYNYLSLMTFYHVGYGCAISVIFLVFIIILINIIIRRVRHILWRE